MTAIQYPIEIPEFVQSTKRFSTQIGFGERPEGNRPLSSNSGPSSCIDEVGSLLRVLANSIQNGRIGEIGTGAGVGTAWMASGLRPDSILVSVEVEDELGRKVRVHFADTPRVEILTGDWRDEFSQRGPFDLVFLDGGGAESCPGEIANLVKRGGMVLIDDLTPEPLWPDSWRGKPDPKREMWARTV